jgi:hypothetical protein
VIIELVKLTYYKGRIKDKILIHFRYVKEEFLPKKIYSTIGVEFATKSVRLRNGAGIVKV